MKLLVIVLLIVCIVMPLWFAWRLWKLDEPTKAGWLVVVADTLVFVSLIFLVGRWDIAGIWTRLALIALIVGALLIALRRHARRPWRETREGPSLVRRHWATMISLGVFSAALVYVLIGLLARDDPHELVFPLRDGRFVVAQGGGNGLLNHHSGHRAQHHAVDISAVGPAGFRARGILPEALERYVIFGKTVVSPCGGTVIAARDDLPDLVPPRMDPDNPAGNHVFLSCGGLRIELAHLRQGSVWVKPGDRVATGDELGQVGNSGNTTEPHLHIHAVDPRSGAGVQMAFDGVVPVRNTAFRR